MVRAYRIAALLLLIWLLAWINLSWPAIQDDALIHLRYADNLVRFHMISYDGVHSDYGASSLLYVSILAALRGVAGSPNLARATSSIAHIVLFVGLAWMFDRQLPRQAGVARLAGLVLLALTAMPSAVRWLDDGMETGVAACAVSLFAWMLHKEAHTEGSSDARLPALTGLAFLMILLRTELLLVCAVGFLILVLSDEVAGTFAVKSALRRSPLILGIAAAASVILSTMHVLLPDTAIAKSHGIANWIHPLHDTAVTLGGAFSFGLGMCLFWLLTAALVVLRQHRITMSDALANCFAPLVLLLAALRGQEIQGVRYFAWTFYFSIVWNVLELAEPAARETALDLQLFLYAFFALVAIDLPFEAVAMHRVLMHRDATIRQFEGERLEVLRYSRGIASDIGYIGYFTGANICDLAGLVNGRNAARLSSVQRARACVNTSPDFIFANISQLVPLNSMANLSGWSICGRYDFTNVTTPDRHYLVVRPGIAPAVCSATSYPPERIESILSASNTFR
jgi:hypothetical protein